MATVSEAFECFAPILFALSHRTFVFAVIVGIIGFGGTRDQASEIRAGSSSQDLCYI
jgi:hypothetical protein